MSLSGVVLFSCPSDSDSLQSSVRARIAQLISWAIGFAERHLNVGAVFSGVPCIHRWPISDASEEEGRKNKTSFKRRKNIFLASAVNFCFHSHTHQNLLCCSPTRVAGLVNKYQEIIIITACRKRLRR